MKKTSIALALLLALLMMFSALSESEMEEKIPIPEFLQNKSFIGQIDTEVETSGFTGEEEILLEFTEDTLKLTVGEFETEFKDTDITEQTEESLTFEASDETGDRSCVFHYDPEVEWENLDETMMELSFQKDENCLYANWLNFVEVIGEAEEEESEPAKPSEPPAAPSHVHKKGASYLYNEAGHWFVCGAKGCKLKNAASYEAAFASNSSLKKTLGYAAHSFDAATGKCVCGFAKTRVAIPTAKTALVYNCEEQIGVEAGDGYTLTGNTATDAGEYKAVASLADGFIWEDGSFEDKEIVWTIAQAEVDSATAETLVFMNEDLTPEVVLKAGEMTLDPKDYTVSDWSPSPVKKPGEYKATVTVNPENKNIKPFTQEITLTVEKASVPIPQVQEGLVYNGCLQEAIEGLGAQSLYRYEDGTAISADAGNFEIIVALNDTENYAWEDGTTEAKTLPWEIAPVEITRAEAEPQTYTGEKLTPVVTVMAGDIQLKANEYLISAWFGDLTEAGEYYAIVDSAWPNFRGSTEVSFTIDKMSVEKPKATENLIYNGEEQLGVASSDYYTVTTEGGNPLHAGNYQSTVSLKNKVSTEWVDGSTDDITVDWTIAKREVHVTGLAVDDKIYDGTTTGSIILDNVTNDALTADKTKLTFSVGYSTFAQKDAGNGIEVTPDVTLRGERANDYIVTVDTVTGNILPLEATFQWGATTLENNGNIQYPTCTIGNLVAGDDVSVVLVEGNNNTPNAPGEYTALVSGLAGKDAGNYALPSDSSKRTTSFKITATIDFAEALSQTYTGEKLTPVVTVKAGDIQLKADEYTISAWDGDLTKAGEYHATVESAALYFSGSTAVSFTVNKASLTVKAKDIDVVIGETPEYGVTYNGFVLGDDESKLGGTLAFSCDYEPSFTEVGNQYGIIPSGLTSNNYDITFTPGTLTVVDKLTYATATVTVHAELFGMPAIDASVTLNGSGGCYTATANYNGDAVISDVKTGYFYNVQCEYMGGDAYYSDNHYIGNESATLTINVILSLSPQLEFLGK